MDLRANPFQDRGQWWWRDEHQVCVGPFATQIDALRSLVNRYDRRNRWEKLVDLLREFIHS